MLGRDGRSKQGQGRTVLFVSHQLGSIISLCTNGILLQNGRIKYLGDVQSAIDEYTKSDSIVSLIESDGIIRKVETFQDSEHLIIKAAFDSEFDLDLPNLSFIIYNKHGHLIFGSSPARLNRIFRVLRISAVESSPRRASITIMAFWPGVNNLRVFLRMYIKDQVLVKFRSGTTDAAKEQALQLINGTIEQRIITKAMEQAGDNEGFYLVHTALPATQAIASLTEMKSVKNAELNYIYTYGATSNDNYYVNGSLWGMYGTATSPANTYGSQAAAAWNNGHTGLSSVVVGIIDEGVMNTHEDLAANCWVNPGETLNGLDDDGNGYVDDINGWDFVNNDKTTFDGINDDHATHVAGTIGAVGGNTKGVAGVCWNVKMISCKFLGNSGGTTANAILALDYLTDLKTRHGLNLVATNNSWGGGGYSALLTAAIARSKAQDILFIVAAGNNSSNNDVTPNYPSNDTNSNVIAVAALNSAGKLSTFSNYGATTVDIAAPGEAIYSSVPVKAKGSVVSGYASYSGTSMATPHVTGAAALYASTHPGASAATIKSAILGSTLATPSLSGKCANGRLNVAGF